MRDAKGRYADLEVAAVEAHFARMGCPVQGEAELVALLDTFEAAAVVLGLRAAAIQAEIESGLTGFGAILWRRFPRACRVVVRFTGWLLAE